MNAFYMKTRLSEGLLPYMELLKNDCNNIRYKSMNSVELVKCLSKKMLMKPILNFCALKSLEQ